MWKPQCQATVVSDLIVQNDIYVKLTKLNEHLFSTSHIDVSTVSHRGAVRGMDANQHKEKK